VSGPPSSFLLNPASSDFGKRLDAFLSESIEGWSRARLQRLIEDGDVLVNGKETKASYKLRVADEIEVELTEIPTARFEPENIPLDIVFEDEYLAVINKPAGMVVHPGAGVTSGTLANAMAFHWLQKPARKQGRNEHLDDYALPHGRASAIEANRPGIVHRLDKETSGLIVVAKNEEIHEALSAQFRARKVEKSYVALVHGSMRENSGKIDRPIARDRRNRLKMTVSQDGRDALTLWKVRQRFEKFTLLDVEIKTGRTHQIRVHFASIHHPVVGDATYNEGRDNTVADVDLRQAIQKLGRQFLHAEKLSFTHPRTGETQTYTAALPSELSDFLGVLKS
jgi:23S rRNA pseudouridine1911/1915/1917 synthase